MNEKINLTLTFDQAYAIKIALDELMRDNITATKDGYSFDRELMRSVKQALKKVNVATLVV